MARIEIQKTMLVDGKEVHVSERAPVTDASELTGRRDEGSHRKAQLEHRRAVPHSRCRREPRSGTETGVLLSASHCADQRLSAETSWLGFDLEQSS
jgi:hypothetical protein